MKKSIFYIGLVLFLLGCSRNIPTPQKRLDIAQNIAKKNAFNVKIFKTKNFDIYSYSTELSTCKDINVYIEGDGLAWITSSIVSDNPTPINPLAFKLMVQDNSTCKLYLARPCQYVQTSTCNEKIWTSHRFSKEVVDSYNEVLDKFEDKSFKLFGYSGGGAIATLVSASRSDVSRLITIAGNLDTEFWTKKYYITPLYGSLNPANFSEKLNSIKQIHFIGGKDRIIDISIYKSYISKFENRENISHKVYKNFTHHNGWVEKWKSILEQFNI